MIPTMMIREIPLPIPRSVIRSPSQSFDFTQKMVDIGVIVTPGSGFGESAEGYIRMTVTEPVERIKKALQRMKENKYIA